MLELEQAKQRVQELRTVIEKTTASITIRTPLNWRILNTMP